MEENKKKEIKKHLDAISELLTKEELTKDAIETYYAEFDVGDLLARVEAVLIDDKGSEYYGY